MRRRKCKRVTTCLSMSQGENESDRTWYRYVIYTLCGLISVTLALTIVSAA